MENNLHIQGGSILPDHTTPDSISFPVIKTRFFSRHRVERVWERCWWSVFDNTSFCSSQLRSWISESYLVFAFKACGTGTWKLFSHQVLPYQSHCSFMLHKPSANRYWECWLMWWKTSIVLWSRPFHKASPPRKQITVRLDHTSSSKSLTTTLTTTRQTHYTIRHSVLVFHFAIFIFHCIGIISPTFLVGIPHKT